MNVLIPDYMDRNIATEPVIMEVFPYSDFSLNMFVPGVLESDIILIYNRVVMAV